MNNENESTESVTAGNSASEQSDKLQENSTLKKVALPASVIFMSCFCGVIACGVTCNVFGPPINIALRDEFGNLPWIYRIAIFLVYVVSVYVGWIVSKDVIRRYRTDRGRKDQA